MKKGTRITARRESAPRPAAELTVTEPGGLLDFLLQSLPNRSRNHVKSLLTHRLVSVDGVAAVRHDTPLRPGQTVQVSRPDIREAAPKNMPTILYEDGDLLAVNKPPGLLSIASDKEKAATAYRMLTDYVRRENPENRIFSVHRLDRETSGVLIVAKNERMKRALQERWAELVSERAYTAVVEGQPEAKSGVIRSWLRETKTHLVYSSYRPGDGLEAVTRYRVLNTAAGYSLLDIRLETGRKNQIRVHMKDLGHSVAGDKRYGAKTDPLRRLALHARRLELRHPFSGEMLCFEAPVPRGFTSLFPKSGQKTGME